MNAVRSNRHAVALAFIAALSTTMSVPAAEYVDTVPLTLLQGLFAGPSGGGLRAYSEFPERFPDIVIPPGFIVVGSIDMGNSMRVVMQTERERDEALGMLSEILSSAGFSDVQTVADRAPTGFVTQEAQSRRVLCRDDLGYLTVAFTEQAGLNLISLSTSSAMLSSGAPVCGGMSNSGGVFFNLSATTIQDLAQHMPVMNIPAAANQSPQPFLGSGGSSASGGTVETSSTFTSDMTVPQLYRHFADQIGSQGWALDSEGAGELTGSGNWIKIVEDDMYLHGSFTIVQNSPSTFAIRFRLTTLDPGL
ncbi:MAG: hypothetical protein Q7U82_18275 [Gammaproteobacteria bacterium]|nr:hypothetical protein [Gammaproteobacteria bacterium]